MRKPRKNVKILQVVKILIVRTCAHAIIKRKTKINNDIWNSLCALKHTRLDLTSTKIQR